MYKHFIDKPLQAIYKNTLGEKYDTLPNRHRNNSEGNKVIKRKTKSLFIWFSSCKLKFYFSIQE